MNLNKVIGAWLELKQHGYQVFLESIFIGKTVVCLSYHSTTNKREARRIRNIIKVKTHGFLNRDAEISVQDEKGLWYSIEPNDPVQYE
jgi:hypothetical protein